MKRLPEAGSETELSTPIQIVCSHRITSHENQPIIAQWILPQGIMRRHRSTHTDSDHNEQKQWLTVPQKPIKQTISKH